MVSETSCSQEDVVTGNKFKQVRTPSMDKKSDLSIAETRGFPYKAANYQGNLNAISTIPAFHSYFLLLLRKIPLS